MKPCGPSYRIVRPECLICHSARAPRVKGFERLHNAIVVCNVVARGDYGIRRATRGQRDASRDLWMRPLHEILDTAAIDVPDGYEAALAIRRAGAAIIVGDHEH